MATKHTPILWTENKSTKQPATKNPPTASLRERRAELLVKANADVAAIWLQYKNDLRALK